MIQDQIGRKVESAAQGGQVVPVPKFRVNLRVIDRVETSIGTVNRKEKRQQVGSPEDPCKGAREQRLQLAKAAAREPVYIGDKLDVVVQCIPK